MGKKQKMSQNRLIGWFSANIQKWYETLFHLNVIIALCFQFLYTEFIILLKAIKETSPKFKVIKVILHLRLKVEIVYVSAYWMPKSN